MAYIGNQPTDNFVTFATQNFSTSATSSYTLSHAVSNENEIALFINNVRQHPGSGKAYTASGTALTLSANTASTDVMYCIFLGRAIQSTVPATNSITNAMITDNTIESGKLFSTFKNGITIADTWRISANASGTGYLTANWERDDTYGNALIGTGMSESSGVFTFPSTGFYQINFGTRFTRDTATPYAVGQIEVTTNNSSYSVYAQNSAQMYDTATSIDSGAFTAVPIDVTDVANIKVRFSVQEQSGSTKTQGNASLLTTFMRFSKVGAT